MSSDVKLLNDGRMKLVLLLTCSENSFHCLRLVKLHLPLPEIIIFLAGRGIFSRMVICW